ncbi:deoxyribodipyrimidine photo-lyase-like [Oncorhynchus tshawytscha]|uniref:deoxyribodipyrimidine photo-lyase-like n=1 Tax=Oncorhynchus tshawytscha TaxID=74940 RepID=UPI000D0A0BE6|nr:deoxyribodipyrimidine photo-lyase-like [Oncorhynchus tshawytscha]XP_024235335.1 deoxyribodipyrimidine photo-lyase-like [Oncorhynchus tshawytscha]
MVDADMAKNAVMWQNGGMCGLDHWNFVMHPVDVAMTCDPNGSYARTWCPELAAVPDDFIPKPYLEERSLSLQDVKLGFVVNTDRQFLLPVITRMEFKHQSDDPDPDAASNPHVSRRRDETIAFLNQTDFMTSVMKEGRERQERPEKDRGTGTHPYGQWKG